MPDIKLNITINASTQQVYEALTEEKQLKAWWTQDCSAKPEVGSKAEFEFKGADFYNVMEITRLEQNKLVEWKCVEAGNESNKEWEGTSVIWEISDDNGKTKLSMIHKDWKEETELFNRCTDGWNHYAGKSLKSYLETGKGEPWVPK